ncbi:MAG: hypothetical protein IT373_19635 [Polyangiaceae bacterium]|nr:hypothetical protein [Polyangiaceae bacterium]
MGHRTHVTPVAALAAWLAAAPVAAPGCAPCERPAPTPSAPGSSVAIAPPPAATLVDDETALEPSPPVAEGAPAASVQALLALAQSCWHDNEGALAGQPGLAASFAVLVGPPRSVIVSLPARKHTAFTRCFVLRASSSELVPGPDGYVRAKLELPPGPP